MAKAPSTTNTTAAEDKTPTVDETAPAPIETDSVTPAPEPTAEPTRITLVKDGHKVTTGHPTEINNLRARGYTEESK